MSETAEANVPTAEAVVEAPKVEEKVGSSKYLDVAKKEAQFVKKEVEYKTRLAEAQKELEELKYFRSAKDTYKDNPEELLNKLGIPYDSLTNSVIEYYNKKEADKKPPTAEEVRKQVEEEFSKRQSVQTQQAEQQAVDTFNKEINTFVKQNEGTYPHLLKLASTMGGVESADEVIFQVVSEYFQETGELLDLGTAAATAEEYFRDEWNKLNGVLSGKPTESVEVKAVSSPAQTAIVESDPVSISKFKVKDNYTITNNMRPVSSVPYKGRNDDRHDIIERAVATYENVSRRTK